MLDWDDCELLDVLELLDTLELDTLELLDVIELLELEEPDGLVLPPPLQASRAVRVQRAKDVFKTADSVTVCIE